MSKIIWFQCANKLNIRNSTYNWTVANCFTVYQTKTFQRIEVSQRYYQCMIWNHTQDQNIPMHCIVMQKTFLIEKKLCCHKAQNHIIEKLSTTGNAFSPRKKGKFAKTQGISASVQWSRRTMMLNTPLTQQVLHSIGKVFTIS